MSKSFEKNGIHGSMVPTAPEDYERGPPPPSYEECLKTSGSAPTAHQYTYGNANQYQAQAFMPTPSLPVPVPYQLSCGYANPYQIHMQQQQKVTLPPLQSAIPKPEENVLYLAKGAKIRTTASGAVSIPPPPPGCAPTTGQMAAMSGQSVVIKKKKKPFF